MNAFSIVIALGAIASASAGILAPASPFLSAYGAYAPQALVAPLAGGVVAKAYGLEGEYIPDNLEKLYDDGSYKPEISPLPLSPSPYGLVPSGSGLEGQYVPEVSPLPLSPSPYGLVPSGSGLEGQYVPEVSPLPLSPSPYGLVPSGSGLEGQYVPEISPLPLSPSPYGLVPAGSGLEGQYVPDITEKLFDDGSYKPELAKVVVGYH